MSIEEETGTSESSPADRVAPSKPWPRECDLVMKGGITSGVVYPSAVEVIARHFTLRNVGGASAGAIAAAAAAAAQFGKNKLFARGVRGEALDAPFARFAKMAHDLGARGVLRGLFRPQRSTRPAWKILEPMLLERTVWRKIVGSMGLSVIVFILLAVLVLVASLEFLNLPVLEIVLALAVISPLTMLLELIVAWKCIQDNDVGLCSGMPDVGPEGRSAADMLADRGQSGVLMPWLYDRLQTLADLPLSEPLTFGHLWGLPGDSEASGERSATPKKADDPGYLELRRAQERGRVRRQVVLELLTTDLTFGRPQRIPFNDELFVRREDLVRLLPLEVVSWMVARAEVTDSPVEAGFLRLPPAWDFPVVFAVRLSLSFPILFSVVPLYRRVEKQGAMSLVRCWFSDGGILSNFPIHLFDQLLPERPTFGINLRYDRGSRGTSVVLPSSQGSQDVPDSHSDFGDARPPSIKDFVLSMLNALQDWQDSSQMRLPGFRDRIVHINLGSGLGGLNINMTRQDVDTLIKAGADAGGEICKNFARQVPDETIVAGAAGETRWEAQRRMRYRCAAAMLERVTTRMSDVGAQYRSLMQSESATDGNQRCWSGQEQIRSAEELVAALCIQGKRLNAAGEEVLRLEHGMPAPRVVLRVTADQHG